MRTTTNINSALEHEILEWAIGADLFEKTRDLSGWRSWDRTGVLTSKRLVINSETPRIAKHLGSVLQHLQDLEKGAHDKYAQTAKELAARIRRVNKGLLGTPLAARLKASSAHG